MICLKREWPASGPVTGGGYLYHALTVYLWTECVVPPETWWAV